MMALRDSSNWWYYRNCSKKRQENTQKKLLLFSSLIQTPKTQPEQKTGFYTGFIGCPWRRVLSGGRKFHFSGFGVFGGSWGWDLMNVVKAIAHQQVQRLGSDSLETISTSTIWHKKFLFHFGKEMPHFGPLASIHTRPQCTKMWTKSGPISIGYWMRGRSYAKKWYDLVGQCWVCCHVGKWMKSLILKSSRGFPPSLPCLVSFEYG